jgi:hypothetical protein
VPHLFKRLPPILSRDLKLNKVSVLWLAADDLTF